MSATTKPDKRKKRKAKARKFRRANPRNGFTPDLLLDTWKDFTDDVAELERKVIQLATGEAVKKSTKRSTFVGKLKRMVAYGIGQLTRKAGRIEKEATTLGETTARRTIKQLAQSAPRAPRSKELGNTVRIPKTLVDSVREMAPVIVGSGSALFDDIVKAVVKAPPESDVARRRLAQQVIDNFADRGITGFIDKSGRRWNMVSYVEMATRTATTALAREAHKNEMVKSGFDVVRVTVMPNCHPFCQPYQGRLLSLTGETTGTWHGEKVVASLDEALAHGYNHPGCRHTIVPAIPGVKVSNPDMIDPGDYEASQQLRALERQVRKWKRAEVAAVTPEGKAKSRAKIREYQGKIRGHVLDTGITRNRLREQINVAL